MTVELQNSGNTDIDLSGTSGTVVLQYVFDIEHVSMFPKVVMNDCFLRVDVTIGEDENGRLTADHTVNPASTVDEYIQQ